MDPRQTNSPYFHRTAAWSGYECYLANESYHPQSPDMQTRYVAVAGTIPIHYRVFETRASRGSTFTTNIPWRKPFSKTPINSYHVEYRHLFTMSLSPSMKLDAKPSWLDRNALAKAVARVSGEVQGFSEDASNLILQFVEQSTLQLVHMNQSYHLDENHLDENIDWIEVSVFMDENIASFNACFQIAGDSLQWPQHFFTAPYLNKGQDYSYNRPSVITPPHETQKEDIKACEVNRDTVKLAPNIDDTSSILLSLGFSVDQTDEALKILFRKSEVENEQQSSPYVDMDNHDLFDNFLSENFFNSSSISPTVTPKTKAPSNDFDDDQDNNKYDKLQLSFSDFQSRMFSPGILENIFNVGFSTPIKNDSPTYTVDHSNETHDDITAKESRESCTVLPTAANSSVESREVKSCLKIGASKNLSTKNDRRSSKVVYIPQTPASVRKLMIVLPESTKGFIFVCDSSTREECIRREIFAAPERGKYGPHNQVRAGDLLFLADFSEKTLTGIFTADMTPRLNIEHGAFKGRYPFQVRVKKPSHVEKLSLTRAFKYMNLEYGARLNLLSRDQLLALLQCVEFESVVPKKCKKEVLLHSTACPTA